MYFGVESSEAEYGKYGILRAVNVKKRMDYARVMCEKWIAMNSSLPLLPSIFACKKQPDQIGLFAFGTILTAETKVIRYGELDLPQSSEHALTAASNSSHPVQYCLNGQLV